MVPSHQRLEARDFLARRAHDRLIRHPQLVPLDRLAQIVLEQLPLRRLAVHGRLVKPVFAASGTLRGIEREVGIADEGVGTCAARVADGDSDGSSDGHLVTLDGVGTRDLFDQGPGKRFE